MEYLPFNLEKPLWVFVGASVVKATGTEDEKAVASDVAKILRFVADVLHHPADTTRYIELTPTGTGQDTGLLDEDGNDIFAGSFIYLARAMSGGKKRWSRSTRTSCDASSIMRRVATGIVPCEG